MQYLSSLYLVSLLKFFQGREADFCDTLQECTLLSRSLVEAWHGKSCFYGMNHSRGRKSLSKNVRWKLLKHNKLSYDFLRNIFENPFTNSSFFFSLTLWILAPVATLPYTGKTAVITLIQIFWGPALSPEKKNNCCFISSFLPPAKETMALRSMTVVSTVKISMLTANYCICDCWSY